MGDVTKLEGAEIGEWRLDRVLGNGADGIVYAAARQDGKLAAVKLFFPESLEKNGRAEAKERLELQLGLMGKKHHPNLVEIYGGGECPEHETLFLAMELIPGNSLDKLVGSIPREKIPSLLRQLSSAVRYLEESLGLYHRDIKPANIVVSDDLQTLTLLDLGVVYRLPEEDDGGRLSGAEFVATLRYSPPEFVWRTEDGGEDGAWRAVSFYQIGATLYDMLAGKPLFDGEDQPRARLYDCVRDKTPAVPTDGVDPWLAQLAQACLLKEWRLRLQFVSWESFEGPAQIADVSARERSIRVKQARREEERMAAERRTKRDASNAREQALWQLNSGLFGEIRTYLLDSSIYPRFRVTEEAPNQQEYRSRFEFDEDLTKGMPYRWCIEIRVVVSQVVQEATELKMSARKGDELLFDATWTEMFTVESAFAMCQRGLLDIADKLLS